MSTAIIIINYNNWEDTINCIKSIDLYNTASVKYVIIDNGSTRKGCIKSLDKWLKGRFNKDYCCVSAEQCCPSNVPKVTLLVSKVNEGYARGNNLGLNYIQKDEEIDSILIINNDVLFVEDIIPKLQDASLVLPSCAIVSPVLYKKNLYELDYNCARIKKSVWQIIFSTIHTSRRLTEKIQILKTNPALMKEHYFPIDMPSGSCMYVKRGLMDTIGGFDPHTFLYHEEDILCSKINKLGLRNYIIPYLRCIHLGASSTKTKSSPFLIRTAFESRSYYLKNYCNLSLCQTLALWLTSWYVRFQCFVLEKKNCKVSS